METNVSPDKSEIDNVPEAPKNKLYQSMARLKNVRTVYNKILPWFYWDSKTVPNIDDEVLLIPVKDLAVKIRNQEVR